MIIRPYDLSDWRPTRQRVLARDGYTCQLRLSDRCTVRATDVHHVIPWRDDPTMVTWLDKANLKAACRSCNITAAYRAGGSAGARTDPPVRPAPAPVRPARKNRTYAEIPESECWPCQTGRRLCWVHVAYPDQRCMWHGPDCDPGRSCFQTSPNARKAALHMKAGY